MNDPERTGDYQPGGNDDSAAFADPAPQPQHIGRYRIDKVLGSGGFGLVYLAHDDRLQRLVAIKVPHRKLVDRPEAAEAYLSEARTVANLDHPNIVPVHDVGSTEDCPCYIVSKYIDGTNLATRIKQSRLTIHEAVELVATVAEALHYAHKQGLVHRDIKPGNILLDRSGKPFVADFGLALREQDVGRGPRYAGTPAYMSPEQARGEGHRVDGRSDIFSLGVVFYELLVGRQPFRADTQADLLEQVTSFEARPPRQYDDGIPKELDRICLKALSKRASERYSTAKDMADDLRHWAVATSGSFVVSHQPRSEPLVATSAAPATTPTSDHQPIKIVPKGLRSFDEHDADFFLELLPGPRDRDGLPDSLRFWKTRIEEKDADRTFSVGLIYGPSGCGKSSLVKAGLLPRLSDEVIAVYVEATAGETETRLLNGLRKRCVALPDNLTLKATLAALRRGQGIPAGKKVVLVLDQFEQWLHAKKEEENTELVDALRQCDGGRVQCIVMVRDDFWLSVSRFLRELEIRLLEGQNSSLVDLFDLDHARRVLAAFGRAFGKLPENPGDTSKDQKEFLSQAVSGLAQEGKIVSVRLALFAEMMKGKAWTTASLKAVGGTEGVGVTFLEETFSAATAPPEHRYHQKAARADLKILLPETGSDIKGHMRSYAELLEASGYGNRPKDFDDLIRILDNEIRLITPTDPEGKDANSDPPVVARSPDRAIGTDRRSPAAPEETFGPGAWHGQETVPQQGQETAPQQGERYYQLTHDYLVHSIREWLTRKQKETRRGRAELLLADRAAVWNSRPENRQLPSLFEWLQIRWHTRKNSWTPPQRKMMGKAGKYHAMRVVAVALVLAFLGPGFREGFGRLEGRRLRDRLLESTTADVPGIVNEMKLYRRWVDPLLRETVAQADEAGDARRQLHIRLALLPVDSGQVEFLHVRLLQAQPQELVVIREALADHKQDLTERLWTLLDNRQKDQDQRFRAACALSLYAPDDIRWEKVKNDVAAMLVVQKPFAIAQWTDAMRGAGKWLIPPLAEFLTDEKRSMAERGMIATVYGSYAAELTDAYARLERVLAEQSGPGASEEAKVALARRQASIGTALLVMGRTEQVWPLLKHKADPTLRSYLIDRAGPGGVEAKVLIARLDQEKEVSARRAILLSLGEYGLDRLSQDQRENVKPRLLQLYREDVDPGLHGAAEWLLRQWGVDGELKKIDKELATGKVEGKRQWYVNGQGQTMIVIVNAGEFWMGEGEKRHRQRIGRSFAVASKEVTVEQFLRFRKDHQYVKENAPKPDCPINNVTWYDAAAYCNWLSEQEGIAKDQWCYEPNEDGKYAEGMGMAPNYLQRTGHRLPTEAEWEYACRAGSETAYSFGDPDDLLAKYAWFDRNSPSQSRPVGMLRPNEYGSFDMHGNAWEWTQSANEQVGKKDGGKVREDKEDKKDINIKDSRVLRGGSFYYNAVNARSSYRDSYEPAGLNVLVGFRPARTYR